MCWTYSIIVLLGVKKIELGVASCLMQTESFSEAVEFFEKSLATLEESNLGLEDQIQLHQNISLCYTKMELPVKSLEHQEAIYDLKLITYGKDNIRGFGFGAY